jgi:hypothetical protein
LFLAKSYPIGEVKFYRLKVSPNIRIIRDQRLKNRKCLPFDRKSPPFLQTAQKGWGTLKFVCGVALDRKPKKAGPVEAFGARRARLKDLRYISELGELEGIAYAEDFVGF